MIDQRHPRERFDFNEYIFVTTEGKWADNYEKKYLPILFTEEENDKMVDGLPIYEIPEKAVASCSQDICGRIYVYIGPRSIKNHAPIYWGNVEKFFVFAV